MPIVCHYQTHPLLTFVETFFVKMTRTLRQDIQVDSEEELKACINRYIDRINKAPMPHQWIDKIDPIAAA